MIERVSRMRLVTITVLLLVAVAVVRFMPHDGGPANAQAPGGAAAAVAVQPSPVATNNDAVGARLETGSAIAHPELGFGSRERLVEHFEKHGREFGDIPMDDYLRRAQALRDVATGGGVLEAMRGDGVVTRFDTRSGAFLAFGNDGVIHTFFRPHDGEAYFHRQLQREH